MDEFWALPAESAPALLHGLRARLLVSGTPPAVPTAGADGLPYALHDGIAVIGVRSGATLIPVFADGPKKPFRKHRIIFGKPYVPVYTGRRGTSEEMQRIADDILREAYALGGQQVGGKPL